MNRFYILFIWGLLALAIVCILMAGLSALLGLPWLWLFGFSVATCWWCAWQLRKYRRK